MNRFKASLLHLFGSVCVVLLVFLLVRLVWYPGRFFEAASGTELMLILTLVDVVLGPLVTLIIFSPAKPSLKFDLTVVVVVQVGFLMYGLWSIYSARPVYIPFDEDRFYLVTANEIDPEDMKKAKNPAFQSFPHFGPTIVGTALPDAPDMREKIKVGGMVGMGIQVLPQYYVPYGQAAASVKAAAVRARELKGEIITSDEDIARLSDYEAKKREGGRAVRFVRLVSKKVMLYVAIDEMTGAVVEIL
ncbi:TfpX/TfpZ family type IV pilin accessory protein [Noviherbaspirillum sp. ST9]|uniref:TfpX/TfpZ family type IV pilin accessory protein n=1 Tax=Noviherbaspirillum sp. ST9 TaxID=3401606 RepID=UPI003B5863F5